MQSLSVSGGLSADLIQRYLSARQRFFDTSSASTSGTSTTSMTSGAMVPGVSHALTTSTGLTRSTDDGLLERLARLATAGPVQGAPPLDLYRTETGEHGEIYIATDEYREWFHRKYPRAGRRSEVPRPAPGRAAEGPGESKVNRFKAP